jgi:hypothetical protein
VELASQETLSVNRRFVQLKKQRCFSRDVATEVDWIPNLGRTSAIAP